MKSWLKKALLGAGALLLLTGMAGGGYVFVEARAFDESAAKVYDVPLQPFERTTDPERLARGKHLAESLMPCTNGDCHGSDLGGGKTMDVGPVLTMSGPNITTGGLGAAYTDAELFRVLRHGIKKDGRTVRLMPSQEFNWLPDADLVAVISWIRTQPAVDRPSGPMVVKAFGKVLDRRNAFPIDVARRIDHANIELAPAPTPTAEYGKYIGRLCSGCHGPTFSGGPIPGAPPSLPPPLNLTPHETGLKGVTYEEFVQILATGKRKDGRKLDPFMATATYDKMNDTEKRALYAFLVSLPPTPYGNR
ncbi:MAG: c-type cytochrome [Polyangiales bacterium]